MSKCKPSVQVDALNLGFQIEDVTVTGENPTRFVTIKIPYESLRDNPEVSQRRISDIVRLAVVTDEETGTSSAASA